MKPRYALLALMAVTLIAVAAAGCTRSATGPVDGLVTATPELPFELDGTTSLTEIAQATQGAGGDVPKSPTEPATAPPAEGGEPTPLPVPADTQAVLPTAEPATEAPPPSPTEPPPPAVSWEPTPGLPSTYTVGDGEHVYCLARRFNIHPGELLLASGLSVNSVLSPGDQLTIPQGAGEFPGERRLADHPTNYSVTQGDTVYSIACEFGDVDPNGIIAVNNLQAPYDLTPGQTLQIP